jgi:hypothetical protein
MPYKDAADKRDNQKRLMRERRASAVRERREPWADRADRLLHRSSSDL